MNSREGCSQPNGSKAVRATLDSLCSSGMEVLFAPPSPQYKTAMETVQVHATPHRCWNCCIALLTCLEMAKCAKMQMHQLEISLWACFQQIMLMIWEVQKVLEEKNLPEGETDSVLLTQEWQDRLWQDRCWLKINVNTKLFGEKCKQNWKGDLISFTSCHIFSAGKSSLRNCSTFCFHYSLDWQGKWNHWFSCERDTPVTSAMVSDGRKVENLSWTRISGPNQRWLNPRVVSLGLKG